jgi:hypothetical protein
MSAGGAFVPAAIAGLSRGSWRPPDGAAPGPAELQALALAAQRLRLQGSQAVTAAMPPAAGELHGDPRPILPPESRRALQRLLEVRGERGEHLAAAMERLDRLGWRLHPFDLPGLESLLLRDGMALGAAERAFLQLAGRATTTAPVSAESWAEQTRAVKLAWFKDRRRSDADGAQAVVDPLIERQPADVRAGLVAAVAEAARATDEPFLRRMLADKAATVRASARDGLARIPGTPERAERTSEVARTCFRLDRAGVPRLADGDPKLAMHDLATISIVDVAAVLGVSADAVLDACVGHYAGARMAIGGLLRAGERDLALKLAERAQVPFDLLWIGSLSDSAAGEPPAARLELLRRIFRPPTTGSPGFVGWRELGRSVGGTLPADMILAVTGWPGWPELRDNPSANFGFAAVTPRSAAEAVLAAFEPAPVAAEPARLFLRFLLTLPGDAP